MAQAFGTFGVTRVRGSARTIANDSAATEEPLEVRLHGEPFAVIMRTPGADRELAAGFLLSEGVVRASTTSGRSSTASILPPITRKHHQHHADCR